MRARVFSRDDAVTVSGNFPAAGAYAASWTWVRTRTTGARTTGARPSWLWHSSPRRPQQHSNPALTRGALRGQEVLWRRCRRNPAPRRASRCSLRRARPPAGDCASFDGACASPCRSLPIAACSRRPRSPAPRPACPPAAAPFAATHAVRLRRGARGADAAPRGVGGRAQPHLLEGLEGVAQ